MVASQNGSNGSVTVHQDASVYADVLDDGSQVIHQLAPNRHAWIQVARGAVGVNSENLSQGDGAAVSGEAVLRITGREPSEILLFDLA